MGVLLLLLEDRLQSLAQVAALLRVEEHGGGQMVGGRVAGRSGHLAGRLLLLPEIAGAALEREARRRGAGLDHLGQQGVRGRGRGRRRGAGRANDGDFELRLGRRYV